MNRAVQYLRRLSQDPQSTQIIISHKQLEFVSACILLLVIYCCNKASNRIVTRSKDLVFYSWIPLSPEVSRLSPYTHAQQHTRTSRIFYIFEVPPTRYTYKDTPSLVENPMSGGRRRNKFWIVSSRLRPYSDISKHSQKSRNVQCEPNPGNSPHAHGPHIYNRNR